MKLLQPTTQKIVLTTFFLMMHYITFGTTMIQSYPGILCTIEGIDGSGKSTLINKLYENCIKHSIAAVCTREPGATQLGKKIREILADRTAPTCTKAEFLLFAADRAQHFNDFVVPNLQQGLVVISDRMADSSLAYQGYLKGVDLKMIQTVNQWCMQSIEPDIVFYLKIDAVSAAQRVKKTRGFTTKFEDEFIDKMQDLINGFETIFSTRKNVIVLDALQDPDSIVQQAFQALQEKIKNK
ncbi:MAG TPA: dTMP kinase [Candidatus Saccharimonadales bacterium]|nr:dTMP kinase [Candidatus Saccharimonadales bacterium]